MNTHLHLLEALTSYYEWSREPLARERLSELVTIESNSVVRKALGACTDKYRRDWTPILEPSYAVVSYGHDIENVWLLMEALRVLERPPGPLRDLFDTLFDYSLRYGYDSAAGGFFYTGGFSSEATNRDKEWWVQAEALISALKMYRLTGQSRYREVFSKTLDWIVSHHVDWEKGDWFRRVTPDGKREGMKADLWKSPYHNGRAVIESLLLLRTP